ncbi:hypothetical protein JANAI62_37220 [Jannaschia pagri]|uniref:Integrase catalytic domain-containing protein n=1 Tax=Jannaschia pagri TaxID=2829797 RepID=A0ABQ4NRR2_9RHOB|nr:hypothetical protein JANAI61_36920 [Jannaschia sp. AI_61]GIT97099.1 hypothetical protein JANAI62_37220 [Jannaschia sp. AI_62]
MLSFVTQNEVNGAAQIWDMSSKPTDTGLMSRLTSNAKLHAECLNAHWFMSLADARDKLDVWRKDHNEVQPHSAIGYKVPADIHNPDGSASPPS